MEVDTMAAPPGQSGRAASRALGTSEALARAFAKQGSMNDGIGAPLAKERGDAKTFPEYDPELGAAPEFTVGLRWAGATNVCDPAGSAIAWPWESNRGEPFTTKAATTRRS